MTWIIEPCATVHLGAGRWSAFEREIGIPGDVSGAGIFATVRDHFDAPAARAVFNIGAISFVNGISTFPIWLSRTVMNGMPPPQAFGGETGDPVRLVWDLYATGTGNFRKRWLKGDFIVNAGATQ